MRAITVEAIEYFTFFIDEILSHHVTFDLYQKDLMLFAIPLLILLVNFWRTHSCLDSFSNVKFSAFIKL